MTDWDDSYPLGVVVNEQPASTRGVSISVLVACLIPVLVLCAGLAVDGAAKVSADRRAEAVAAQAARAGQDAAAPFLVSGQPAAAAAVSAAQQALAAQLGVSGQVKATESGAIEVTTQTSVETVFLSIIGIDTMSGSGSAVVELRAG